MKVTAYIWKYRAEEDYAYTNYFLQPGLVDKIKITEIPADGIPLYNEELEKRDGVLEFTAGDFDLKLSLLSSARSSSGCTIKEFLLPEGERSFMYLCIIEFGDETDLNAKRIGGRVELNTIEADLTETRNRYDIRFKVTGLIKELAELQERMMLTPLYQSLTIDMFISGCLVPDPAPPYLGVTSRLNWNERLGFEPKLMWEVYNDVISRGIGKGKWSVFKELARGFGFMFKIKVLERVNIFDYDHPAFVVETFWRSAGLEQRTVKIKSIIEKYSDLNSYKNYLVVTYRSNVAGRTNHYAGMLKDNRGNTWIADNFAGQVFEEMIFDENSGAIITAVNGASPPVIAQDSATIIHLPTYETEYCFNTEGITSDLFSSEICIISLFCREYHHSPPIPNMQKYVIVYGVKQILIGTIDREYDLLIGGIKKSWCNEISSFVLPGLEIYDVTVSLTKKSFARSIRDLDLLNNSVIVEWVEC